MTTTDHSNDTIWLAVPAAELVDIKGHLIDALDRMKSVIATDLVWSLELQIARLNSVIEQYPHVEKPS